MLTIFYPKCFYYQLLEYKKSLNISMKLLKNLLFNKCSSFESDRKIETKWLSRLSQLISLHYIQRKRLQKKSTECIFSNFSITWNVFYCKYYYHINGYWILDFFPLILMTSRISFLNFVFLRLCFNLKKLYMMLKNMGYILKPFREKSSLLFSNII